MNIDLLKMESELKCRSQDSTDDLIKYILFELQSPIEDYCLVINLLKNNYPKSKDVRLAILGAYLSSTWQSFKDNSFLKYLEEHLVNSNAQTKSIIYYLLAYDIYMRCDKNYPTEYSVYLQKSIYYSERFVYNYVRLAEISNKKDAKILMEHAISNVSTVWSEKQLQEIPFDVFLQYETFIDEFILGVDISSLEYEELLKKKYA